MTEAKFTGEYYPRYRSIITAIARKLARTDDDLVQDLEQEGAFALFQLDVSKATRNPDSMIRQAVKFRMIDYLRRVNPRRYESLDARLEDGDQLERDSDGELRLLTVQLRVSRVLHEGNWDSPEDSRD